MSDNDHKTERFELLLRPNIPAEAALLDELESLKGVYGGKTGLLRECLRRGFAALSAAADACHEQASEEEILNAFSAKFSAGEYSYRIGKLFLDARAEMKANPARGAAAGEGRVPVPVVPEASPPTPEPQPDAPQETQQQAQKRPVADWSRFRNVAGRSGQESE
ncbi:hypothetical protein [Castellaniella sp.]|uniref:hypothetical protein n=1 Tax=Castellaniella sp. TaxID=1955812 RepID=UPI002AFE7641|nr:hypothetical protein [Castellaniella sp.]